jgi:hypothetical protein
VVFKHNAMKVPKNLLILTSSLNEYWLMFVMTEENHERKVDAWCFDHGCV